MGYDFKNALETINIELEVHQHTADGITETVKVNHIFDHPTAKDLDHYRKLLSQFKGRHPKADFQGAAVWLWQKTIVKVEGYDGLGEDWKKFFLHDPMALIHVTNTVDGLMEVASPSGDFEKN